MGGEEVDAGELREFSGGDGFHEADGVAEGVKEFLVAAGAWGIADEFEVPVFGVVEVSEAAFGECADEVEGEGGAFVGAKEELGIGDTFCGSEAGVVDNVTAIAGE